MILLTFLDESVVYLSLTVQVKERKKFDMMTTADQLAVFRNFFVVITFEGMLDHTV